MPMHNYCALRLLLASNHRHSNRRSVGGEA